MVVFFIIFSNWLGLDFYYFIFKFFKKKFIWILWMFLGDLILVGKMEEILEDVIWIFILFKYNYVDVIIRIKEYYLGVYVRG